MASENDGIAHFVSTTVPLKDGSRIAIIDAGPANVRAGSAILAGLAPEVRPSLVRAQGTGMLQINPFDVSMPDDAGGD